MKLKIIDLFCGLGGFNLAFSSQETVFSSDNDPYVSSVYELNFNKNPLSDIKKIKAKKVPDHDIICAGFPCQSFSIAGKRQGFKDTRGTLFFDVARIIKEKKPKVVFLENVKGLVSHDEGRTLTVILNTLKELGYNVSYKVLNTAEYGNLPQNRERIYIVGYRKDLNKTFKFPKEVKLKNTLDKFINRSKKVEDKYYYTKFKFQKLLEETITSKKTAYQWRRKYVRENKNNLCPALTANMGTGGHNVPLILDNFGIRKLTPRECFDLQGYPKSYKLLGSDARLYKMAGNSVSVPVVKLLADQILKDLNNLP